MLPAGLRLTRYDKRRHGLSQGVGDTLAGRADDAIAVINAFAAGPVVFVGLSIGGLIGQAVAKPFARASLVKHGRLAGHC